SRHRFRYGPRTFGLALPDNLDAPAGGAELALVAAVAAAVGEELGLPVGAIRGGSSVGRAARMLVPEAAVDEDHLAAAGKHQVRRAGQVAAVQTVAVAGAVDQAADEQLRLSVLAADARHDRASLRFGERVHFREACTDGSAGPDLGQG